MADGPSSRKWPYLAEERLPLAQADRGGPVTAHPISQGLQIATRVENPHAGDGLTAGTTTTGATVPDAVQLRDPPFQAPAGYSTEWGDAELAGFMEGDSGSALGPSGDGASQGLQALLGKRPGEEYTIGVLFDYRSNGSGTGYLFGMATGAFDSYAFLRVQRTATIHLTWWEVARFSGATRQLYFADAGDNEEPELLEKILVIIRTSGPRCEAWINGALAGVDLTNIADGTLSTGALTNYAINALWFGFPSSQAKVRHHALYGWDRWISDDDIQALHRDPLLPFRPYRDPRLDLVRRRIPCPGFPVVERHSRPVDMTDGAAGTPIIMAEALRVDERVIEVNLDNLTRQEDQLLLDAWDNGRGLANPFRFTIPGEAAPELVVFADDTFVRTVRSARSYSTRRLRLLIVSPPGWSP